MKKILRLAVILLLSSIILTLVGCKSEKDSIPKPTEKFFVNDFAEVLSENDAEEMYAVGAELQKKSAEYLGVETGAQVVAVTVDTTGGMEPSEYALEIGRTWGVGGSEYDNGIVILLATEDREVYVSVGYGFEDVLPDSKVGRIIDNYGYDYFAENEFSSGMLNLYRALVREAYLKYGLTVPESVSAPKEYNEDIDIGEVGISWLGILVLLLIFVLLSRRIGPFFIFSPFFRGFDNHFGNSDGFGSGHSSGGFGGFFGGGGGFGGGGAGRGF